MNVFTIVIIFLGLIMIIISRALSKKISKKIDKLQESNYNDEDEYQDIKDFKYLAIETSSMFKNFGICLLVVGFISILISKFV
jgi:hypothetical protein